MSPKRRHTLFACATFVFAAALPAQTQIENFTPVTDAVL
jgi:hypothetical protein